MSKVIITQEELPIPFADHISKFQFRVVNENRNIFSDWSTIDFIKQQTLLKIKNPPTPSPIDIGDVLTPSTDPADHYESTWVPLSSLLPNNIVYSETNHDIPAGGNVGEVLTKLSNDDYVVDWQTVPSPSPQDVHFAIGISMFA